MSLKSSIAEELKRAPVAAVSGAISAVLAAIGLLLAWGTSRSALPSPTYPATAATATAATNSPASDLVLSNVFLVVAYFLAVTVAAAILLRIVARKHEAVAFFASIPLVALTNFSAILVIYLAPPRPVNAHLFASAHDLVFYASAAIVIVFCGTSVLADIARPANGKTVNSDSKPTDGKPDPLGVLLIGLIVLALWSWLVFAGQTRLTRTLLPEVTHPVKVDSPKSGT